MKRCYNCKAVIEIERITRRDECPKCGRDLHVCLNCRFYDEKKAHFCAEVNADPPREKDRANFCEYFEFREEEEVKKGRQEAEKLWEEIFKKKQ